MQKEPLKIIGINPGTHYLGIAIFQDSDLRDWRVKAFRGKWSREKMEKIKNILLSFIDHYEPNILAIKKLHPSRRSENLKYLVAKIKELSRRRGLRIYQFSIKDIEKFFLTDEKKNKKNLIKTLASEYSELFYEFSREKCIRNPYYIRQFEATALALMAFRQLDKS